MNIEIIEIDTFRRSLKRGKITRGCVDKLKAELSSNPEKGDLIPNSGGLRKIRMALENSGKRGGARVIYLYLSIKGRIYLITAYRKTEKENLTCDDLKAFRQMTTILKEM